jgi:hypothetical protein
LLGQLKRYADVRRKPAKPMKRGSNMNAGDQHRTQEDASQRRWVMYASLLLLLTMVGCAPGAIPSSRGPSLETGAPAPPPTVASVPSPSDPGTYPRLSRFRDPVDRFMYQSSYSDCHLLGIEGTAEVFGGDPNDPDSVAQAYAVATFPNLEMHREPTFWGCLDALVTET